MKPPASFAFSLALGRGESARGRRPSLRRSRTDGNRLSRLATARQSAGPSLGPSGESSGPDGRLTRKANQ